jgi:hypothetical protein
VSVTGKVSLEDLRVLMAGPDTQENAYKVHVANAGRPNQGPALLVSVILTAVCTS